MASGTSGTSAVSSRRFDWKAFVDCQSTEEFKTTYKGYYMPDAALQFRVVSMLANRIYENYDLTKPPKELHPNLKPEEYVSVMKREVCFWMDNFKILELGEADKRLANKYIHAIQNLRTGHYIFWYYKTYGQPMWDVINHCQSLFDTNAPTEERD